MSDHNQSLVPMATPAPAIRKADDPAAAIAMFGGDESPIYCSFDLRTDAGKALLFRASQEADAELLASVGRTINLQHVFAAVAEKTDPKNGETITLTRIVLVDVDGTMLGCFSQGVRKALKVLFAAYGLPPYPTGIRLSVKTVKTGSGFQLLTLVPVVEDKKGGRK